MHSFNFYRPEQQQGQKASMPVAYWLGNGEKNSISLSDWKGCQGGSA
jgi:hypothetical protein